MTKITIYGGDDLYLVERQGRYYVHGTVNGKRIRKSCGTGDLDSAGVFLKHLDYEITTGKSWRDNYNFPDLGWETVVRNMHNRQKNSAIKRGIPYELKVDDVYAMMKATGFRCAVSGIAFAKRASSDGKRDPWAASIDRIESRQGYSIENSRVVCLAANLAMNEWGLDVLLRLSRGIHRSSLVVASETDTH